MYVGELEGLYKTNIQRHMVPLTRQAHTILQDQGFDERLLRFETSPQGTHDTAFFSRQFPAALKWMFG
ncbi:hypothetical protein D3C85_1816470 [compost metagenome]